MKYSESKTTIVRKTLSLTGSDILGLLRGERLNRDNFPSKGADVRVTVEVISVSDAGCSEVFDLDQCHNGLLVSWEEKKIVDTP